jgi:hypothetical protein
MRSYHIFRTWSLETLAIAFAIGLTASIGSVLAVYDGKPVPDWGANLNLNALLALLSTILRAILVIIVAQIISQRKWDWFGVQRARPLADLQQFDDGSRGAYGALLLIPTVFLKDFITLAGALVLLVSFLVGPFVQQASGATPCSFPSSTLNASLPFAHQVPRIGGYSTPYAYTEPAPDLVAAIISSVVSPNGIENKISISCATGNCTFNERASETSQDIAFDEANYTTHSTVGMCSMCTDVASLVMSTIVMKTIGQISYFTEYTLPNGLYLSSSEDVIMEPSPNLTWMGSLMTHSVREASRWAYVNVTLLNVGTDPPTASACSLYPCQRTYKSIVEDNQLYEQETQSTVMRIELDEANGGHLLAMKESNSLSNTQLNYTSIKSPCRLGGRDFHPGDSFPDSITTTNLQLYNLSYGGYPSERVTWPEQCIYRQPAAFVQAISIVMNRDIFDGQCERYKIFDCTKNHDEHKGRGSDLDRIGVNAVLRPLVEHNGSSSHANITKYFDAVANAMTNRFRFQYGSATERNFSAGADVPPLDLVYGTVWESKVCVEMRVKWLILPIFLTFITSILSMWTIFTNWKRRHTIPVWKESILPLLFYGQNIIPKHDKDLAMQQSSKHADEDQAERFMEAGAMAAASRHIMVNFQWLGSEGAETDEQNEPNESDKTDRPDEPDDQGESATVSLLEEDGIPLRRRDSRASWVSSIVHEH